MAREVASSHWEPKVMVPIPIAETTIPLRPSLRRCIVFMPSHYEWFADYNLSARFPPLCFSPRNPAMAHPAQIHPAQIYLSQARQFAASLLCGLATFSLLLVGGPASASDKDYQLGPDSMPKPGVPKGTVTEHVWDQSKIFPGTTRR